MLNLICAKTIFSLDGDRIEGRRKMDPNKEWLNELKLKQVVEKLKAHGFEALSVKTKEDAAQEDLEIHHPKQRIGVGGSVTIRELGILEKLEAKGYTVYDHWKPGLSKEKALEIRKSQMTSDLFLSSANAVTLNGELVNIDGMGTVSIQPLLVRERSSSSRAIIRLLKMFRRDQKDKECGCAH